MNSKSTFYRPELDALRFGAFLMVFFYHFAERYFSETAMAQGGSGLAGLLATIVKANSLGVDVFFCLSAFLITTLLLREQDAHAGSFGWSAFVLRRGRRIWPLYGAFVGAMFLVALVPQEYSFWPDPLNAKYLLMDAAFLGNFSYLVWPYVPTSIAHLWSVSMEEQFYIAWAAILKFKPKEVKISSICWFMLAMSFGSKIFAVHNHIFMWTYLPARLDSIIAGILFAVTVRSSGWHLPTKARFALLAAGTSIPVACLAVLGIGNAYNGWGSLLFYPISAGCSLLLLGAFYGQEAFFVPKWMREGGRISYGLYVFHMPVLRVLDVVMPDAAGFGGGGLAKAFRAGELLAVSFGLTYILAHLSYHQYEKRWMKPKAPEFAEAPAPSIVGSGV